MDLGVFNREGVATRCPDPAVQKRLEVDLPLLDASARVGIDLERDLVRTAKEPEAQPCSRLRARPGSGQILARVLRYAIHASRRFPRVQAFVS
jgi:hypothetical protein